MQKLRTQKALSVLIARGLVALRIFRESSFWPCLFCGWAFSRFISIGAVWTAFGIAMVGYFMTLWCFEYQRQNVNVLRKFCSQCPTDWWGEPEGHKHLWCGFLFFLFALRANKRRLHGLLTFSAGSLRKTSPEGLKLSTCRWSLFISHVQKTTHE